LDFFFSARGCRWLFNSLGTKKKKTGGREKKTHAAGRQHAEWPRRRTKTKQRICSISTHGTGKTGKKEKKKKIKHGPAYAKRRACATVCRNNVPAVFFPCYCGVFCGWGQEFAFFLLCFGLFVPVLRMAQPADGRLATTQ